MKASRKGMNLQWIEKELTDNYNEQTEPKLFLWTGVEEHIEKALVALCPVNVFITSTVFHPAMAGKDQQKRKKNTFSF